MEFTKEDLNLENGLEKEWLKDISSLQDYYPQGMLLKINERGTVENFVLKCTERLCGAAQLEITEQTNITMKKYLEAVSKVDKTRVYTLDEAVKLVKETSVSKFDGSVEIAMRLNLDTRKSDQQLRGAIVLPNGTGKEKLVLRNVAHQATQV